MARESANLVSVPFVIFDINVTTTACVSLRFVEYILLKARCGAIYVLGNKEVGIIRKLLWHVIFVTDVSSFLPLFSRLGNIS